MDWQQSKEKLKSTEQKSKDEVNNELVKSLVDGEEYESEELNYRPYDAKRY